VNRLLVANRGEIALRVMRTARALGLQTVAVHTEADRHALHVRAADFVQPLAGSYLDIPALLAAARASGADAVHPGYGFLSENADFAQAVQEAGLCWIGPPPAAIRALGSKAAAKALAEAHGVPCLPGYAGPDQSAERFLAEAQRIGYPVMVKAVAGGGGRGMRLVHGPGDLPQALERARSEALAGFGDGTLLIERALTHARHVEVQVFADAHGNCIHLGERDCSVQRRHQKIIEEAPSPAVDESLRVRLGASAVALARAAGYVGAGTVEFLLQGQDFHLLEMNTRLQVEHPVTEALTGLDLVAWQIRVARGEPLPLAQEQVNFSGHAIEVRLCAEDEHFHPHTGRVVQLREPAPASAFCWEEGSGLRLDHALEPGLEVGLHFDPMLGKVIARGATREEARMRLVSALRELVVLGLPTNRGFLLACLDDEDFVAGRAAVPFLQEAGPRLREAVVARERAAVAAAACAAFQTAATALPCAWPRPLRWRHRGELHEALVQEAPGSGAEPLTVNGKALQRAVLPPRGEQAGAPRRWHLQWAGIDWFQEDASFEPPATEAPAQAGLELRAPFNGRVLRVAVQAGDVLGPGSTAVVIESMKLEHALGPAAGQAGLVVAEVTVRAGQQVAPGQVLLRLAAPAAGSEAGSA